MDRNEIEMQVLSVLNSFLNCEIKAGEKIERKNLPNWDSLKHIEIMFALEEEFEIEFSENELAGLDSVSKIIDSVQDKNAT